MENKNKLTKEEKRLIEFLINSKDPFARGLFDTYLCSMVKTIIKKGYDFPVDSDISDVIEKVER